MGAVSMRNSEMFGQGETGCEKFRNMMEVIEATNATLGVSALPMCRWRRTAVVIAVRVRWIAMSVPRSEQLSGSLARILLVSLDSPCAFRAPKHNKTAQP